MRAVEAPKELFWHSVNTGASLHNEISSPFFHRGKDSTRVAQRPRYRCQERGQ